MRKKNVIALVMAAALACSVFAQSKKPVVPAAVAPVKTVKVLTSRLAATARLPIAKEDSKAKKTTAKAVAKPVAVAKLATPATTRKNAASEKAIQPAETNKTKTKLTKTVAPETKLAAKDARTKAPQLNAVSELSKGKFGKGKFGKAALTKREEETATVRRPEIKNALKPLEPKRAIEPVIAKREREDETPRRIRPRVTPPISDDELTESAKEPVKEKDPAEERIADAPKLPIAKPDRIEVVEPNSPQLEQLQTLRNSRPLPSYGAIVTRTGTPPAPRKDISIPQQRVFEIQYELAKRGFYTAEPNGLYDDVTIASMWEFQKNYGLPATGYPTAHALKRLGLTSW